MADIHQGNRAHQLALVFGAPEAAARLVIVCFDVQQVALPFKGDWDIDLDLLEKAITPRTKALIPVHLSGLPVDMDRLYEIARAHKLRVVEDAAQAFGSTWKGERIGKLGDMVSFSFHANKNLTSIEGGALVLNNEEEAILAQKYRLQGVTRTGFDGMDCDVLGGKYNLTDVAARVGLGQLPHLERFLAQRRKLVRAYFAGLQGGAAVKLGIGLPFADTENSNWHMFQVVLPPDVVTQLRAFETQVRLRWTVYEEWGFGQKMNRGLGITALFAGDSGTGKTMAAEVIAKVCAAARAAGLSEAIAEPAWRTLIERSIAHELEAFDRRRATGG